MKSLTRILCSIAVAAVLAVGAFAPNPSLHAPFNEARAAVPNVAVGAGQVVVVPLHVTGAISATVTGIAKWNMPFPCRLIGVGASSQAIVGTTNTIDVKLGGVSVLSAPITIAAAGTYTEGTITTANITDEGVITVDITIAGTSLTHTTVMLTCVRR